MKLAKKENAFVNECLRRHLGEDLAKAIATARKKPLHAFEEIKYWALKIKGLADANSLLNDCENTEQSRNAIGTLAIEILANAESLVSETEAFDQLLIKEHMADKI